MDSDSDEPRAQDGIQSTVFSLGSCAHAPRFATLAGLPEEDCWLLAQRRARNSLAHDTGVLVECAAMKMKAASELMELFQHFIDPTDWFNSVAGEQERGRRRSTITGGAGAAAPARKTGESAASRAQKSLQAMGGALDSQAAPPGSKFAELTGKLTEQVVEKQKNAILARAREKLMQEDPGLTVYRQRNRLNDRLTEDTIKLICNVMYDSLAHDNGTPETPALTVSSVEAALIAWDLTSQIEGAWRVPLTILTKREGMSYGYVCILVCVADHVGVLGRSCVKEISLLPLARRRVSDALQELVARFAARGHLAKTVYLGVPAPCPVTLAEAREVPVIWRYLKMSCSKQRWKSIRSTADVLVNRAAEVRAAALGAGPLPRGLAALPNSRGAMRIKAAAPLLARHQRPPRLRKLPPMCATSGLAGGVWDASEEDLMAIRSASPPDVWAPRAKGSALHEVTKGTVEMRPISKATFAFSALQAFHGAAQSAALGSGGRPGDVPRGTVHGAFGGTEGELRAEGRQPEASFDAAFLQEDCSSVSSASAEEWLEDWRLASASLWEVQEPADAPPRPARELQPAAAAAGTSEDSSSSEASGEAEAGDGDEEPPQDTENSVNTVSKKKSAKARVAGLPGRKIEPTKSGKSR